MVKIFTISFTYSNQVWDALVSVVQKQSQPEYTIQLSGSQPLPFFFSNKLSYTGTDGYKELKEYTRPETRELIDRMALSIEKYASEKSSPVL